MADTNSEWPPEQRLAELRRRHANFPDTARSPQDECFLMWQVSQLERTAEGLRVELTGMKDEHDELVSAKGVIASLEERYETLKDLKDEIVAETDSTIDELREKLARVVSDKEELEAARATIKRLETKTARLESESSRLVSSMTEIERYRDEYRSALANIGKTVKDAI